MGLTDEDWEDAHQNYPGPGDDRGNGGEVDRMSAHGENECQQGARLSLQAANFVSTPPKRDEWIAIVQFVPIAIHAQCSVHTFVNDSRPAIESSPDMAICPSSPAAKRPNGD